MNRPVDSQRLVVIGAGVAGLSAGCYAARSGYRVTLLEMHDKPGGLCTSWRPRLRDRDGRAVNGAGTTKERGLLFAGMRRTQGPALGGPRGRVSVRDHLSSVTKKLPRGS
jgi:monoamine oxidase